MSRKVIRPTAMNPSAEVLSAESASPLATIKDVEYALNANISTAWVGSTAKRPPLKSASNTAYFDTTLGTPVWFDGTNWVDASGTIA